MSNELEQRALDNAADDYDRRHTLTPTPQVDSTCTCPSGDGSLRWPCPQHPPTPQVVETVEGPHSRACGARKHGHGPECHQNCPTCAGKDPMTSTPDVDVLAEVRAWLARWDYASLTYAWDELRAILDREAGR